ncbi:MAG: 3-phosphoshikimate 1-carboxyvinyltransferase [Nitrospiraceae bacterium]|nr:3-phosphoshikimate 1-carboxyvinyltransferase [Nitrospiraceae bacterium]
MSAIDIRAAKGLRGEVIPPPDKSISHRAVMLASIADGRSIVRNFLYAHDPVSTLNAMRSLGINIDDSGKGEIVVHGKGLRGLSEPSDVIDCGNSGTTMRLISGILSGNPFFSVLTGDSSLRTRPMARVIEPLRQMGGRISARQSDRYAPLAITGGGLRAIDFSMPVASAQVKSCVMLAGLYAEGTTTITEPLKSRDHTESMLAAMGGSIKIDGLSVKVSGGRELAPFDLAVPADFSSAAFFIAAALMIKNSELLVRNVGINPTRTGFLDALSKMGAGVEIVDRRIISGEPVADILCRTASGLKAAVIGKELMPSMIDEFPILCILATQADGVTEIRGAGELRVKESDRIKAMAEGLGAMGVDVQEHEDGLSIKGPALLKGSSIKSCADHRIAMSFAVASLAAEGSTYIDDTSCVDISFPGFISLLKGLAA